MRYIFLILLFGCYRPEPIMMPEKITFKAYSVQKAALAIVNRGKSEYFSMSPGDTMKIEREFKIGEVVILRAINKEGLKNLYFSIRQRGYKEVSQSCVISCSSISITVL